MSITDAAATTRTPAGAGRSPDLRQQALRWLLLVALAYCVVQLLAGGITRLTSYDEAVYLTEVQRGSTGVAFASHRARGASWVVWPTAALGAPVWLTRVWLATLSSTGLFLGYRTWIPAIGRGAPLAAAAFASCWVTVLFGNEIESNLFAALGAVAAVGLAVQPGDTSRRERLVGIAASMCLLAVFRPTDVVWAGLTLVVALPFVHGLRRSIPVVVAGGLGAVVGWVPWIVEAALRFGGPVERFRRVSSSTIGGGGVEGAGVDLRIQQYLSLADSPRALTSGSPPEAFTDPQISAAVVLGTVLVIALVGLGVAWPRRGVAGAVRAAAVGGVAFMSSYVVLTGYVHIRFLLPAWGLAAVPAAEGLLRILRFPRRAVVVPALVAVLGAWYVGQYAALRHEVSGLVGYRAEVAELGGTVGQLIDEPCYIYSHREYPNIALWTGCRTEPLTPEDPDPGEDPDELAAGGVHTYALARDPVEGEIGAWPQRAVPGFEDEFELYAGPAPRS